MKKTPILAVLMALVLVTGCSKEEVVDPAGIVSEAAEVVENAAEVVTETAEAVEETTGAVFEVAAEMTEEAVVEYNNDDISEFLNPELSAEEQAKLDVFLTKRIANKAEIAKTLEEAVANDTLGAAMETLQTKVEGCKNNLLPFIAEDKKEAFEGHCAGGLERMAAKYAPAE